MTTLDLNNLSHEDNALLNITAQEIRQEYNAIIESVSMPHIHNINWIVGSIASRNKYYSPLFFRLCTIAFIEKKILQEKDINKIIVNDKPLSDVLRRHFKNENIKVICTEKFIVKFWKALRPVRQYLIAFALLFLRYIGRSTKSISKVPLNTPITLIDMFVLNNNGDEGSLKNGIYKDRYYPGLLENLTNEEKKSIFFLPTIVGFKNPISVFKKIRKSNTAFIVHDDFLKLSDYLFILMHPFRVLKCRIPSTIFQKINITHLLKQENRRNCSDFISLLGLLYYRFSDRLAQSNIKVRLLVDWYENQVIDRGMIVGFHQFLPNTKIIGYQGYIIAKSLHLYTCPNTTEYLSKAVPDIISVVGEGLKENLFEFCKDVTIDVGPGFRFQKLWRERIYFPDKNIFTVLIGLPIGLDDSKNILSILANGLSALKESNIQFLIKPHPTWAPERIKQLLPNNWPSEFQFKTGDFHDSIESANLLISNASSVTLEALAKGVPVIIIGAQAGINQNPIPETISEDLWSLAYTTEECISLIQKFKNAANNFDERGVAIRKKFFEPVSRESVVRFLNLY